MYLELTKIEIEQIVNALNVRENMLVNSLEKAVFNADQNSYESLSSDLKATGMALAKIES